MDKKQIRRTMKAQRARLSEDQVLTFSGIIWNKIYAMASFKAATMIFLYSSIGNEVNTVEMAKKALAMGKRVAYPVTDTTDNTMAFHTINDLSELVPVKSGRFNLWEPKPNPSTRVVPDLSSLMIVPGLAFDELGYRTGYGGGFYDKYIAEYPSLTTLGVCYDFQVVGAIPRDAYDQAVDGVVTVGA